MTTRRRFLASLGAGAAAGIIPAPGWADVGDPAWLSAARERDGGFALFGIRADGNLAFRVGLPARGHAGARHPIRPIAVMVARRPGRYVLVIDCASGALLAHLTLPEGIHFNGHAAFLEGGELLATSEQRAADSAGQIGLWDARTWARIDEWATGGIGPHEVALLPDGRMAVANGGIATDPTDRRKLNLATMRPSLAILGPAGAVDDLIDLPELRQNSIRHLAVRGDGTVALAMQWEGPETEAVPLLGLWRGGAGVTLGQAPETELRRMNGYAGSVAWSGDGRQVVITSPRGGRAQVFNDAGRFVDGFDRADVCGVAPAATGVLVSDGTGILLRRGVDGLTVLARHVVAWDNHLVPV